MRILLWILFFLVLPFSLFIWIGKILDFSPDFVTGLGMGGGFGFFTAGVTYSDVYSKNQAARFGALMGVIVSGVFLAVFIYVSEHSLSAVGGVLAGYIISAFCGFSLLCYLERRKPAFWIRFKGK